MVGEGVTQMGTCELQWRGPERKTIEVDGMLREGGAEIGRASCRERV